MAPVIYLLAPMGRSVPSRSLARARDGRCCIALNTFLNRIPQLKEQQDPKIEEALNRDRSDHSSPVTIPDLSPAPAAPMAEARSSVPPGPRAAEPVPGTILGGQYRLEERIGAGGMGIVFRATDLNAERFQTLSTKVAIKVLRPELRDREAELYKEVSLTKGLQQENIVFVDRYVLDESGGSGGFMVMEFLSGEPLDQFVSRSWSEGVPFDVAFPYIKGMGDALSYAHQHNVIHSDFKPSNVFAVIATAKVIDFGIARAARAGGKAAAPGERPIGLTPEFASCEMLAGAPLERRDDVFCFALVVYFLLSGAHPFGGRRATEARDAKLSVPPIRALTRRQHAALAKALRFERQRRTPSVAEVVEELRAGAPRPGRVGFWAGLAAALIAIGAAGYLYYQRHFALQDSDSQFLADQCAAVAQSTGPGIDPDTVATLLRLGNADLRDGTNPFDPGLLSEGVSSALDAFKQVAAAGPNDCRTGAQGVLRVVKAYKTEARRLYEAGNYDKAAEMTGIALRIWPDSTDMKNLRQAIKMHATPDSDQ
jgi:serine/threonine protein kinase